MQTLSDASKIQANKEYYAGKPFSVLLKDIKPKVISYIILPDASYTKAGGISLLFESTADHINKNTDANANGNQRPATIGVYFSDIASLNNMIKNRNGAWTQGLTDSLSNLTIRRVYAFGKN